MDEEQKRGSLQVGLEPIGWRYVLVMEHNQCRVKYYETQEYNPFGIPGADYDESYKVVETPLYAIPEGWQLVPVIPTPEMVSAGINAARALTADMGTQMFVAYRAALSAAPKHSNVPLDRQP